MVKVAMLEMPIGMGGLRMMLEDKEFANVQPCGVLKGEDCTLKL
jgi:hypothetical protein